jgi:hypothetical protein
MQCAGFHRGGFGCLGRSLTLDPAEAPRQVIRIDSMYLTTRAYMDPPSVAGEQNYTVTV